MTQEQKQFIAKALQTGCPALAQEYISALEELTRVADAKQEELNGLETFSTLNQEIFDVTIKVIKASAPYMASEYTDAYVLAVNVCQAKFNENKRVREEKEKAEAEKAQSEEAPASDTEQKSA